MLERPIIHRVLRVAVFLFLVVVVPQAVTAQPSAAVALSQAKQLFNDGFVDSALVVIDGVLSVDSVSIDAWRLRAAVARSRGENAARIKAVRHVLAHDQYDRDAMLEMAQAFLDSGLVDSARRYLETPLRISRGHRPGPLFVRGRLFEHDHRWDSAASYYRRAYTLLDMRSLVDLPSGAGERIGPLTLRTLGGGVSRWNAGVPTILLFWAPWSTDSQDALRDVVSGLSGSGITWRFLPLVVSREPLPAGEKTRLREWARDNGIKDTLRIDRNLSLWKRLGLWAVPTTVFTGLDGSIEAVETGWDDAVRERVLNGFLGGVADTASPAPLGEESDSLQHARHLLGNARRLWRKQQFDEALRFVGQASQADPGFVMPALQTAVWRWQRGDTVGARLAAAAALRLEPLNRWALLVMARIEHCHGRRSESVALLQRATSNNRTFVPAWSALAIEAALAGDIQPARMAVDHARALNPLDPRLDVAEALLAEPDGAPGDVARAWRQVVELRLRRY